MPWRDASPMDQRTQFIADHPRDSLSITELRKHSYRFQLLPRISFGWIN